MAVNQAALSTQAAVVGAMLIDPAICGELFAATSARDLVTADYRDVYEAARALFFEDKPVDAVTVLDKLGGGAETRKFLMELMDVTPSAANWKEYAALLREQARLYRLQQIGEQLIQARSASEAQALLEQAQSDYGGTDSSDIVGMTQGLTDFLLRQGEPVQYVQFGIGRLDRRLYASMGDFIIIGGRPSAGKTLLSVQMADVLSRTYRVGFFSLETSPEKLYDRFFAQAIPLDFGTVKQHRLTAEDFTALAYRKREYLSRKLEVIRAGGYSAADIQAATLARRYQVIFVDYLQLVRTEKAGNRTEEVSAVSRALHTLSQRHGVMVIALAQLSRPQKGSIAPPTLSDLRESGQIEQDADIVLLLSKEEDGDRLLQVAKNKEGETGKFSLAFDGQHQQLVEYMEMPKNKKPVSGTPVLSCPAQDSRRLEDSQLSMEGN